MSGGVDSTLAAALLLREGQYEPVGVTLRLWPCEGGPDAAGASCCGQGGVVAAREAAASLGIRHLVFDCHDLFRQQVLEPAWQDYSGGRTPNPCVHCNGAVKWAELQHHARRLGAAVVATGHYARVDPDADHGPALLRGLDRGKDQSYFLFSLSPEQLSLTRFPLGEMEKAQVRAEAARIGLPNAARADSQDACLGGDGEGFAEALCRLLGATPRPGALVGPEGQRLGEHGGVHRYTIGQRRGLGVATGSRTYVTAIRPDAAEVVLSQRPEDLSSRGLVATGVSWLAGQAPHGELRVEAQIRYRHRAAPATVTLLPDGAARVRFDEPQRAVTPGQAAVFYQGERVLGGGWIARPEA